MIRHAPARVAVPRDPPENTDPFRDNRETSDEPAADLDEPTAEVPVSEASAPPPIPVPSNRGGDTALLYRVQLLEAAQQRTVERLASTVERLAIVAVLAALGANVTSFLTGG